MATTDIDAQPVKSDAVGSCIQRFVDRMVELEPDDGFKVNCAEPIGTRVEARPSGGGQVP